MPSPALQVLTVAELLDIIFHFTDQGSNKSNALVCKQWSEVALDVLWYEVDNIVKFLDILVPVHPAYGNYDFNRAPAVSDWKRFDHYRFRVRCLSFCRGQEQSVKIADNALYQVASTRPSSAILPNLHTLKWIDLISRPSLCVIFMHQGIKRLTIRTDGDYLLRYVSEKTPHITHLNCQSTINSTTTTSGIVALIKCLPNLKELRLSPGYFTPTIAKAAADHQKLESIGVDHQGNLFKIYDDEPKPRFKKGAYPSLSKLEIVVSIRTASSFLHALPARVNLTDLRISSPISDESATSIAEFITVIAANCQCLHRFALTRVNEAPKVDEPDDDDESGHESVINKADRVNIDYLRPLFMLQRLIHFEISHRRPLLLQPTDIEEIATSMPNIETLILNNKPSFIKHPDLKPDALFPFARHCPRLHTLGLFMDATVDDRQYILNDIKYPVFTKLRCLSVGYSTVEDEDRVAWFLSLISPDLRVIESDDTHKDLKSRCEKWRAILKVLPLLKKVRMDEREQAKLLVTEA